MSSPSVPLTPARATLLEILDKLRQDVLTASSADLGVAIRKTDHILYDCFREVDEEGPGECRECSCPTWGASYCAWCDYMYGLSEATLTARMARRDLVTT